MLDGGYGIMCYWKRRENNRRGEKCLLVDDWINNKISYGNWKVNVKW